MYIRNIFLYHLVCVLIVTLMLTIYRSRGSGHTNNLTCLTESHRKYLQHNMTDLTQQGATLNDLEILANGDLQRDQGNSQKSQVTLVIITLR